MCIICVKPAGAEVPPDEEIYTMFVNNPHGAGYMVAQDGMVRISKGYMCAEDFFRALQVENFGVLDTVVYHFRISTQAGVKPSMTQPFPISHAKTALQALDIISPFGVAHNGIIKATSRPYEREMSDTALFVQKVLSHEIRRPKDITKTMLSDIEYMIESKMVILDGDENLHFIGKFSEHDGRYYSNNSWEIPRHM